MAGYKAPNQQAQFNNYISEVNPDLYGQVIMTRQAQYDQGVQRTQQYIDNTTGLRVGRPEDQRYLQEKIAGMKSQFENLGAADYATSDVVRQAGSIAAQVGNDRRVQKDVISAANYADAQKQIQAAQTKGTYADSNAWQVQKRVEAWQNGGEDAALSKTNYIPNYNMQPELSKYMKDVKGISRVDYSKTDSNGNPLMYVLDKNEYKLLTPQEAKQHVSEFIAGNTKAQTQLAIDKDYYLDHVSPEQGLNIYKTSLLQNNASLQSQIEDLQKEAKLKGKTDDEIAWYQQRIKGLSESKGKYDALLQNPDATYADNYRSVLGANYEDNFAAQSAHRFVIDEQSHQLTPDLVWEGQLKAEAAQLNKDKFEYEKQKDAIEQAQKQKELALKEAKLNPSATGFNDVVLPSTTPTEFTAADYDKTLAQQGLNYTQTKAGLISTVLGDDLTSKFMSKTPNGYIIKDQAGFNKAYEDVTTNHKAGFYSGKDPWVEEAMRNFYEGDGENSLMGLRAWERRVSDWDSTKKSMYTPTRDKFFKEKGIDPNKNVPLNLMIGGKPAYVSQKDIVDYNQGVASPAIKSLLDQEAAAVQRYNSTPNNPNDPFATRGANLVPVSQNPLYQEATKSIATAAGLNEKAREINNSLGLPSVTLGAGTDEDSKARRQKVIKPLSAWVMSQKSAGDKAGDVEGFLANVEGVKYKEDGILTTKEANINAFEKDGKFYARIVNAPEGAKTTVVLNQQVVATYFPELLQTKTSKILQDELQFNAKQGKDRTESYSRVIHKTNDSPGYSIHYDIVNKNGLYYPNITYNVAGDEVSSPKRLKYSGGLPSVDKAYEAIQTTLRLNKQQFEDLLKNNN